MCNNRNPLFINFSFDGKASQSEFLLTYLIASLSVVGISHGLMPTDDMNPVQAILLSLIVIYLVCVVFVIYSSVVVRRLHDIGVSGWWYFSQSQIFGLIANYGVSQGVIPESFYIGIVISGVLSLLAIGLAPANSWRSTLTSVNTKESA